MTKLSDKQQFPVLGQWPHFIVDHEFKFVDVIAYGIEVGHDSVVVGYGFGALVFDLVGYFACLNHLAGLVLDKLHVLGHFLNVGHVLCSDFLTLLFWEKAFDLKHIVEQDALIAGCNRDDVV